MHLLYRSTSFCIPAEKKLFGCPNSNTCSTRFKPFHPLIKLSFDSWCSVHTEPIYDGEFPQFSSLPPKETALRHVVLLWCNLAKDRPCFRPRCCHSTEGRALYCTWLNFSTGIVKTAQCASSSLSWLPRNLKIAFTFWIPLVYIVMGVLKFVIA